MICANYALFCLLSLYDERINLCLVFASIAGIMLRDLLQWPRPLPLEDERVRLLHEVRVNAFSCSEM